MAFVLGLLAAAAIIVVFGVGIYNGLVALREQVEAAWSDIDVQLKRRHDLVPNLVETVRGYASHERETLEAVIQARNAATQASGPEAQGKAEQALVGSLRSIFALAESYPQLRAAENFQELQRSLEQLEQAIQGVRTRYNEQVRVYNTRIRTIPANFVAGPFGFTARAFFEIEEEARAVPQVRFDR